MDSKIVDYLKTIDFMDSKIFNYLKVIYNILVGLLTYFFPMFQAWLQSSLQVLLNIMNSLTTVDYMILGALGLMTLGIKFYMSKPRRRRLTLSDADLSDSDEDDDEEGEKFIVARNSDRVYPDGVDFGEVVRNGTFAGKAWRINGTLYRTSLKRGFSDEIINTFNRDQNRWYREYRRNHPRVVVRRRVLR